MRNPIRVLLVDDEPAVRRGLSIRLGAEHDIDVVGQASDGRSLVDLARSVHPDVVVMDVRMPDVDGLDAMGLLSADNPEIRVVLLTMYDDARTRTRAEHAGVGAFVSKHDGDAALLNAIRRLGSRHSMARSEGGTP